MNRLIIWLVVGVVSCLGNGCTRVKVKKVTSPYDQGIRYYRPKPYLFVSGQQGGGPAPTFTIDQGRAIEFKQVANHPLAALLASHSQTQLPMPAQTGEGHGNGSDPFERADRQRAESGAEKVAISMKLEYLPDFAEEYAIDFRPGLGSGELNVNLENGWNLTSIGVKTDQQTDEIIGSVASLVGAFSGGGPAALQGSAPSSCIYGTNVPFGFYEAVIACDPHGRKQLYGWRYVGFMPFQACPLQAGGLQSANCNCDAVYGMVLVNGVLQFQEIGSIPKRPVDANGKECTDLPMASYGQ